MRLSSGTLARVSFRILASAVLVIVFGVASLALAQPALRPSGKAASGPADARAVPAADNPVADPKAVVTTGHARFTVLTPQLIRMEWWADGKFEAHASCVFITRKLPVPEFKTSSMQLGEGSSTLTIGTSSLTLSYTHPIPIAGSPQVVDPGFTAENLSIRFTVDGKQVVWHPGDSDSENLMGTTRTLDTARGSKTEEPIEQGLVSRAGWTLVDDSTRPLFDSADFRFLNGEKSEWPWSDGAACERASGCVLRQVLFRLRPRL